MRRAEWQKAWREATNFGREDFCFAFLPFCQQPITSHRAFSGSEHWIVQIPLFFFSSSASSSRRSFTFALLLLSPPPPSPPKDKQRKTFGYFNFTLCDINSCRRLCSSGACKLVLLSVRARSCTRWWYSETKPLCLSYCFLFTNVRVECGRAHLLRLLEFIFFHLHFITFSCGFLWALFCVVYIHMGLAFFVRSDNTDRFWDCLCDTFIPWLLRVILLQLTRHLAVFQFERHQPKSVRTTREKRIRDFHIWKFN